MDNSPDLLIMFIESYIGSNGFPPSYREIADIFGISPATVTRRVRALRDAGKIEWIEGKNRTLRITV